MSVFEGIGMPPGPGGADPVDDKALAVVDAAVEDEDDDEDIDETPGERLLGLTEMFPEGMRSVASKVIEVTWGSSKWAYSVGRVALWVAASSATILVLPVMFESERAQMEEQQLQQQRQILLGPNVAGAGGMPHPPSLGAMPTIAPPQR